MFLPVGDAPNPKGTPWMTYLLVAANVAAFLLLNVPLGSQQADTASPQFREYVEVMSHELQGKADLRQIAAQTSQYDLFAFEHGYRPNAPRLADLLTCMFLHGGFMHLFGNMLFLWIYGDNVERRLGAFPYLFAYLATGVVATLSHALFFRSSDVPLVGASGAISGVLGFYFVFFPRNVVRMLAFLPPFLMQVFQIPARFVLGMYILVDNLLPFLVAGEGGVAHGAHIGGFVAGAIAGRGDRADRLVEAAGRHRAGAAPDRDRRRPRSPSPTGGTPTRRGPTSRCRSPRPSARSRRTRRSRSGSGSASTGTPTRRSPCCGASSARGRARRASPRPTRSPGASCSATWASPPRRSSTCGPRSTSRRGRETRELVREELAAIDGLQKRRVGRLHAPPPWAS